MNLKIIFSIILFLSTTQAQTESIESNEIHDKVSATESLDYPELQVVPRASERVLAEAQQEKDDTLLKEWPLLLPSTLTLLNGIQLSGKHRADATKDERDQLTWATRSASLIGGSALFLSYYLQRQNAANQTYVSLRKISAQSKRGQLHRERISEEFLESQASLRRKIEWLSMGSQFLVNGWLYSLTPDKNRPLVALTGLTTSLPFIFESRSITNYENYLRSKRRIYIPISGVMMVPGKTTRTSNEAIAGLTWVWNY